MKATIALTFLMALALSHVWPSDEYASAALKDAIKEQREQLHIAYAERQMKSTFQEVNK